MSKWIVTVERTLTTDFCVEADDEAAARIKAEEVAGYTDTEDFDRLWDKAVWVRAGGERDTMNLLGAFVFGMLGVAGVMSLVLRGPGDWLSGLGLLGTFCFFIAGAIAGREDR